jgi:hypothetical protein
LSKKKYDYYILAFLISGWLILIGLLGNYITDIIDIFVKNTILALLLKLLVLIIIFICFIVLLYKNKKRFKFYALSNEKLMENNSFKAIIFPISIINKNVYFSYTDYNNKAENLKDDDIKNIKTFEDILNLVKEKSIKEIYLNVNNSDKDSVPFLIFDKNDEDKAKKNKSFIDWLEKIKQIRWSWAVPLLIMTKNSESIEHVRLICTKDTNNNGSINKIYLLKFIILCLFKKLDKNDGIIINEIESFEKFYILSELVEKIEKDFEETYNFNDKEIAFDVTGGNKIVSVIGTFFTLKSQTPILYVSQNENDFGKIWQINAIINIKPPE